MKASTKRIISIFATIVFFGGLVFFYSVFIRPEYDSIIRARGEAASRRSQVSDYRRDLSKIDQLTKDYEGLSDFRSALAEIIPPSENTASAVMQIGGLADVNRISIRSLSVQVAGLRPSSQSGLVKNTGTLRINIRAQGEYESFKNFVRGIETNMRVMDIKNLRMESLSSAKNIPPGWLDYSMVVEAHYEAE